MTPEHKHLAGLELAKKQVSITSPLAAEQLDYLIAQAKAAPEPVQGEAVEFLRYWFMGDAGQPNGSRTCNKSSDGSLAFFESACDAELACRRHPGTEVYSVEFISASQHNRLMAAAKEVV
jgi:hypothetical protein